MGVQGLPVLPGSRADGHFQLALADSLGSLDAEDERLSLTPLHEPLRELARGYPAAYPLNIYGQTPHTSMALQISALCRAQLSRACATVHSVVGESGMALREIERDAVPTRDTGHAWAASLFETRAIARLARARAKSYGVGAIVLTHGESDAERADYAEGLRRLWRDYNADLSVITGQSQAMVLLLTQQSSSPAEPGSTSASTLSAWQVARESGGDIVCAGPRYQYDYDHDHIHLTAKGYARLGEKYGQVFFQHVIQGRPFRPLEPIAVERRGPAIVVRFHVPVGPLRWDESLAAPGDDRGFQLLRSGTPLPLAAVELEEPDTVVVTPREMQAGPLLVRYALSARTPRVGGTVRGGQLCDSDPFVGAHTGTPQPNYAVSFELSVKP